MAATLTDRDSLERAFYRLLNTDATDDALIEHDDGETLEAVYQALQSGVWDAQEWLIHSGLRDRWLAASTLSSWTTDGDFKYQALPDDFLRYAGSDRESPLWDGSNRWGREISLDYRRGALGNFFWLQNERLYVAKGASLPTGGLTLNYHFQHPTLAATTEVNFPVMDRPLIVAYAAVGAMEESWVAGGPEMETKLQRNLDRRKNAAYLRANRSMTGRKFRPQPMIGSHWIVGG